VSIPYAVGINSRWCWTPQ